MKSKESFASKWANDSKLTKVDPQLVILAIIMSIRLRAFILKVPSINKA
jgi:hypothetical protein